MSEIQRLLAEKKEPQLLQSLTELAWLEQRMQAGVGALLSDFSLATSGPSPLSEESSLRLPCAALVNRETLTRIKAALSLHRASLERHPQLLFSTLYNSLSWCEGLGPSDRAEPPQTPEQNLSRLMLHWREQFEASGRCWLRSLRPPSKKITKELYLSPTTQRAFSSEDNQSSVWSLVDGSLLATFPGHFFHCFASTENLLLLQKEGYRVIGASLYSTTGQTKLLETGRPSLRVSCPLTERYAIIQNADDEVRLFDSTDGAEHFRRIGHSPELHQGETIVQIKERDNAVFYEIRTGKMLFSFPHREFTALSPDNSLAATMKVECMGSALIEIWDTASAKKLIEFGRGVLDDGPCSIRFVGGDRIETTSAELPSIVSEGDRLNKYIWDITTGAILFKEASYPHHKPYEPVHCGRFTWQRNPNNRRTLVTLQSGAVIGELELSIDAYLSNGEEIILASRSGPSFFSLR